MRAREELIRPPLNLPESLPIKLLFFIRTGNRASRRGWLRCISDAAPLYVIYRSYLDCCRDVYCLASEQMQLCTRCDCRGQAVQLSRPGMESFYHTYKLILKSRTILQVIFAQLNKQIVYLKPKFGDFLLFF